MDIKTIIAIKIIINLCDLLLNQTQSLTISLSSTPNAFGVNTWNDLIANVIGVAMSPVKLCTQGPSY